MAEYRDEYIADVGQYVRDVNRGADAADKFKDKQEAAALAARKMALAANQAGDKAASAQRKAADAATVYEHAAKEAASAAEKLAKGEIKEAEAAKLAAQATKAKERSDEAASRAVRELERAEIKGAEASMAATKAAHANARAVDEQADQYRQLARDAKLAAASQRLAALTAGGGFRKNRDDINRLVRMFPQLAGQADKAFKATQKSGESAFSGLRGSGVGMIALIAAGITALPAIAELAGGAIATGVGGGLIALGLMATKSDKQVRSSLARTKDYVQAGVKDISAPFKTVWLDVARESRNVWDAFSEHLRGDFQVLAPAASGFVRALGQGLVNMRPGIDALSNGFAALLRAISAGLPRALATVGHGLENIGKQLEKNPEDAARLVNGLIRLGGALLQTVSWLMGVYHAASEVAGMFTHFGSNLAALTLRLNSHIPVLGAKEKADLAAAKAARDHEGAVRGATTAQSGLNAAQGVAAMNAMVAAGQFGHESQLMLLASQSAKDLKTSLDALTGKQLGARDAAIAYGQSILAMNQALKENGKAHGMATQKGLANEQALQSMIKAAQANAVAMRDNGASARQVASAMEGARKRIYDAARQMGYSKAEARSLANTLSGVTAQAKRVPKGHRISYPVGGNTVAQLRAITGWANSAASALSQALAMSMRLKSGGYVGWAHGGPAGWDGAAQFADGGYAQGYPVGGVVRGPGTATSDSIAAYLSNGEYVINAAATRLWRPVLDAINYGKGRPAAVSRPSTSRASGGGGMTVVINVGGSVVSERNLVETVRKGLAQRTVYNPGNNGATVPRGV